MSSRGVDWTLVRRHLYAVWFGRRYVAAGKRIRAAVEKVRANEAAGVPLEESFCEFMDAVAPGWRQGR